MSILASSILLTGTTPVNAVLFNPKEYSLSISTTGSSPTGTGSIAVAAFFSGSTSKGFGAFSGELARIPIHTPEHVEGIFALTDGNPATLPILPCGPAGQVGASGTVTYGSFKGEYVEMAACVGTSDAGVWRLPAVDYFGSGPGSSKVSSARIIAGTVLAANTVGAGSAGAGSLDAAQVLALASDGTVLAGGAFVDTTLDIAKNNNWITNRASIQPRCTLTTQGVTSTSGSFPKQPITTSATLVTCPPTNLGPQPATVTLVIGTSSSPIFAGHGSGIEMAAIQNTR